MLIWVIKDGECLPIQRDGRRMRAWMLAEHLVNRGHRVVWWHSTFSHQRKILLSKRDCEIRLQANFTLRLVHGGIYRRNVSLRRYVQHHRVGNRFQALARAAEPPDGIICAFPTIDLADRAVRYAVERNIPIVIDVRDLWPDTFLERVPRSLRPLARLALSRDFHRTRRLFTSANALVAISGGCLAWALRYAGRKQGPRDRVFHTGYPDELVGSPHSDRPSPPAALAAANNKVLFTFSGSFGVSYNLRSVCEVARLCRNRGVTNVHFVLAGEGDQSADLARETAGLPNVTLTGWLAPGALRDLLACSHVGFMPLRSVRDAFPNKAFEYLSAGLPILSSLEGEMEQLLAESEAGFSYREGDTETLFSLVARLAHNPDLRSHMSRNARTLFEQRFRESHLYDAYAQHVERMFEPKSNGDEPGQHGDVASIPRERSMPRAHAMP